MTAAEALRLVERHGVMLASARGPVPRLTEAIAGEPIKGSWWGHPRGKEIFAVLQAVTGSEDVLVCRLVDGKVTLVHRRLWPALVRIGASLPPERVARVHEEHTPSGRHATTEIPLAEWASAEVRAAATAMSEADALAALGAAAPRLGTAERKPSRPKKS